MSEEEIDRIRKKFNFTNDKFIDEIHGSIRLDMSFVKDFKKLLNYIDELQKELEQERKLTNLIIDDFQAENYFINMTNKEVRKYYSKRKELK